MGSQPEPGSNAFLTFDVTSQTLSEPGLPGTTVMEVNKPCQVKVKFSFAELFANFLVGLNIPCEVSVSCESIGPGPEKILGITTVTTVLGQLSYEATVPVPANQLPPGNYKLVAAVTITNSPIAGFIEGPLIQMIPAFSLIFNEGLAIEKVAGLMAAQNTIWNVFCSKASDSNPSSSIL